MMDHVSLKEVSSSLKLRKAPPQRRYVGLLFRGRLKQWSDSSGRTLSSDGSYPPPATFVTTNANHLPSILKYPTQSLSLAHEFLSNHCNEEEEEEQQEERKKQLIDNTPHSDHKRTRCKQVRFGDLTISSHEIILGDNPAVSSGFPITIEWKAFAEVKETIEEYEQQKKRTKSSGWRSEAVVLPPTVRESMIESESTRDERNAMARTVGEIQKSRLVTANAFLNGNPQQRTEKDWQWRTLFIRNDSQPKTKKKSHLNWIRE